MLVFHFRLGGKVFSMDLPLPVWWEIILSSFVGLMDPKNIGLAVEIAFLSCLQADKYFQFNGILFLSHL